MYANTLLEREGETVEHTHLTVPNYVLACKVNVSLATSDNLTIHGSPQSSIVIIKGEAKSTEAKFSVVKNTGASPDEECYLTAYFTYNGRPAGRVQRRATLADVEKVALPVRAESIKLEPSAPRPDITILVVRENSQYKCRFSTSVLDEFRTEQCETWDLPPETSDLISNFFSAFLDNSDLKRRPNSLIGGGRSLFNTLPKRCREMFWKLDGTSAKTMLIISQEPFIPWELMVPIKKVKGLIQAKQPLGIRYAIGRWVLSSSDEDYEPPPSQIISVSKSYVVAPPLHSGSERSTLLTTKQNSSVITLVALR